MKKNRLAILACMCMMATLPACKDFLNTEPSDSLPTDKVLSEYSLLPSAVNGLYDGLQGNITRCPIPRAMLLVSGIRLTIPSVELIVSSRCATT